MYNFGSAGPLLFSAILVAVGYLARLFIERFTRRKDWVAEERGRAYLQFVKAVATAAHGKSNQAVAEAKASIGVLGSKRVVDCLYQFEQTSKLMRDLHSQEAFIAVVATMRRDLIVGDVRQDQLSQVLFGQEPR